MKNSDPALAETARAGAPGRWKQSGRWCIYVMKGIPMPTKRSLAATKAARTRKLRAAGKKAAKTRKRRAAARKAVATKKLQAVAPEAPPITTDYIMD
jgi:hypothetical protein